MSQNFKVALNAASFVGRKEDPEGDEYRGTLWFLIHFCFRVVTLFKAAICFFST